MIHTSYSLAASIQHAHIYRIVNTPCISQCLTNHASNRRGEKHSSKTFPSLHDEKWFYMTLIFFN